MVSFQSEKLLQVNFSDKLFDLINDTRQLSAYGFVVNQKILDASSKAKQFLEQAKLLFQVSDWIWIIFFRINIDILAFPLRLNL